MFKWLRNRKERKMNRAKLTELNTWSVAQTPSKKRFWDTWDDFIERGTYTLVHQLAIDGDWCYRVAVGVRRIKRFDRYFYRLYLEAESEGGHLYYYYKDKSFWDIKSLCFGDIMEYASIVEKEMVRLGLTIDDKFMNYENKDFVEYVVKGY